VLCGAIVNGKPNFNVLGNFGIVSLISPKPIIYVSSNADHYTNIGIREHQEFSVCFPHAGILAKADYCGMYSGHKVDKSSIFKTQFGALKFAPLIEEMHVGFACKVVQQIPVNGMEVFFGEIIEKFAASSCLTNGKPDPDKIAPITYAPGVRYNSVGPTIGTPWSDYRNAQL
jgi:flavin reductase (DIM6/NTAB) family NADH-FMN oxidoreductase RutF